MPRFAILLVVACLTATAAQAQSLVASPNPITGEALTIHNAPDDADFEIYDLLGRRLDARARHAAGVYLWRLRLADGTRTPAQSLTRLTAGRFDVHLRTTSISGAAAPVAAARPLPEGQCRIAAPVFGGFQHQPRRGSTLIPGPTMTVAGQGDYAALQTCLGNVGGVGYYFPPGGSPWSFGAGTGFFQADVNSVAGDGSGPAIKVPVSLRSLLGTIFGGDFRVEFDKSSPKLVEVLAYNPDGTTSVVASAVIPAGTPETRRVARFTAGGGATGGELAAFQASGSWYDGTALLDSVFSVRVDIRAVGSGFINVNIPGATVQGDAVQVSQMRPSPTRPSWIIIESFRDDGGTPSFEISDLGFYSQAAMNPTAFGAPFSAEPIPSWLRPVDPNGLIIPNATGTEYNVRCARGASCASYGLAASAEFVTDAPSDLFTLNGMTTGQDHGLLFGTTSRFETTAEYSVDSPTGPVDGEARITLRTLDSRSLVVQFDDQGATPTVTGGEVRYIRDGVVRRQFPLTDGQPLDLGLRVELSDAEMVWSTSASGETTLIARYIDIIRPNSIVEIGMAIGPPGPASYYKIEWTYWVPWSVETSLWNQIGSTVNISH